MPRIPGIIPQKYLYPRYCLDARGTGIELMSNIPKCRVPVYNEYRTYRSVGYRYRKNAEFCRGVVYRYRKTTELTEVWFTRIEKNTQLPEVSATGIEAVPNKYPYPRYFGLAVDGTSTRGTGIDFTPSLPIFRVAVSNSYRILLECSIGYCGRAEHSGKLR